MIYDTEPCPRSPHWDGRDVRELEEVVSLLTSLSWVDPSRLGVLGEGRGGHLALSALLGKAQEQILKIFINRSAKVKVPYKDGPLCRHLSG